MKLNHARRSSRPSFTLVELMIVIAIISVLISLISAAVWKAMATANRTRNRSEIAQLSAALETFKAKYGFYPPSRLMLAEKLSLYPANVQQPGTLAYDSVQILLKMFTKAGDRWNTVGIDWNGNRTIDNGVTILEGDQCLFFFLGGIPGSSTGAPNCTGFSTNSFDPAYHISNNGDTLPPFFEFDSSRLRNSRPGSPAVFPFYVYLDTYRLQPYAFFSSGNSRDNYNRHYPEDHKSDCSSLSVWPYAEAVGNLTVTVPSTPHYINPSSFQVISAGADGRFGPGTIITGIVNGRWIGQRSFPAGAGYTSSEPGYDDQCNFRESTLAGGT